jgi:SPP1 gp7 family putative phage head morphogenesis protein
MDRQTNQRLTTLDRRLKLAYKAAEETADKRLNRVAERLAQFELMPDVPPAFQQQALQMHLIRLDRETGLVRNIANDIARTGDMAGQMIRNESLATFQAGYRSGVGEIKTQLRNLNMSTSWSQIDRQSLNALYNGQNTRLGNFPNNPLTASFEQVQSRQVWQRNIVGDRRRGTYYFERALGRLGNNADIVQRLQNQLGQSLILGESIPQLATRIRSITQGCRMQAVRIARTECLRALNQGKMICYYQARDMGIRIKKKWISTNDERTRESHEHLMGEIQELDEPFSNGLMYAVDPSGPPEETIGCRCIVISVVLLEGE